MLAMKDPTRWRTLDRIRETGKAVEKPCNLWTSLMKTSTSVVYVIVYCGVQRMKNNNQKQAPAASHTQHGRWLSVRQLCVVPLASPATFLVCLELQLEARPL